MCIRDRLVPVHQFIDVDAISLRGGNAAGRSVRLLEIAHVLQLRHLISDGRGGKPQSVILSNRLRADRLSRLNIIVNYRL